MNKFTELVYLVAYLTHMYASTHAENSAVQKSTHRRHKTNDKTSARTMDFHQSFSRRLLEYLGVESNSQRHLNAPRRADYQRADETSA